MNVFNTKVNKKYLKIGSILIFISYLIILFSFPIKMIYINQTNFSNLFSKVKDYSLNNEISNSPHNDNIEIDYNKPQDEQWFSLIYQSVDFETMSQNILDWSQIKIVNENGNDIVDYEAIKSNVLLNDLEIFFIVLSLCVIVLPSTIYFFVKY